MSKGAPFYRVVWEGVDVSDKVSSFKYRDSVERNNRLAIILELENPYDLDSDIYRVDTEIRFKMGLLESKVSEWIKTKVKTIKPKFASKITLKVEAYDYGADLKEGQKPTKSKVDSKEGKIPILELGSFETSWIKSSDIAKFIAEIHNMKYVVDDTEEEIFLLDQVFWQSHHEILEYLVSREDGYEYYTRGNTLYFVKRDLGKKPAIAYSFGNDPRLISFQPEMSKLKTDNEEEGSETSNVDPETGETKTGESEEDDTYTGKRTYDGNSVEMKTGTERTGSKEAMPTKNKEEAKNAANSKKKDANIEGGLTAEVKTEGEPNLGAGELVTINGVSKRYSGNWYIHQVEHKIEYGAGYTALHKWGRNAAGKDMKKDTGEDAENTNKEKGSEETNKKKQIPEFDENLIPKNNAAKKWKG